jgi:uncharacterized protein YbaP (TraB family)
MHQSARCKFSMTAIQLTLALSCASGVYADTSVWEVKSGANTLYLGGTVHLLRPADYPLPAEFDLAYGNSSRIYFETDISSMNDLSIQAQMLQQLTYNDERTLKTVLNEAAYTALTAHTEKLGLPILMLEKFKPGMIVSTLQVLDFQRMGFTPQGVDVHFNAKAVADGKYIGQFETIQEQIGFLAAMGEGNESEFILLSLKDLEQTDDLMAQMLAAWRSGNAAELTKLFVDDMRNEAPEIYQSLLLERNLNWLPDIEAMLGDADTEFVLVGAAHLIGPEGLVVMLEEKGYQVRHL